MQRIIMLPVFNYIGFATVVLLCAASVCVAVVYIFKKFWKQIVSVGALATCAFIVYLVCVLN